MAWVAGVGHTVHPLEVKGHRLARDGDLDAVRTVVVEPHERRLDCGALLRGEVLAPTLSVEPRRARRAPNSANCIYASFLASVTVLMRRF